MCIANFLDVQFNSTNGTYKPYGKHDNTPVYINKKSNHTPVVLKQLPKLIAKWISDISSDENIFPNSIPTHSEELRKSDLNDTLIYNIKTTDCDTSAQKKLKRKVPLFSLNVKQTWGKYSWSLSRDIFQKKILYTRFSIKTR